MTCVNFSLLQDLSPAAFKLYVYFLSQVQKTHIAVLARPMVDLGYESGLQPPCRYPAFRHGQDRQLRNALNELITLSAESQPPLERLEHHLEDFDPALLRAHAERFSRPRFRREMSERISPENRAKEIVMAAIGEFVRKGYRQTQMDDIAKRSNLSKGTLYWYFKSKDSIVVDLFERIFSREKPGHSQWKEKN